MPGRYLIVEDHPLFAEALQMIAKSKGSDTDVTLVQSLQDAKAALESDKTFDLIVLDLKLPDCRGFEGLLALRNLAPKMPVVVVSAFSNDTVKDKCLVLGAAAFVSKAAKRDAMKYAFDQAAGGHHATPEPGSPHRCSALTHQQMRVLQSICAGLPNKMIARQLDVVETTIKAHVSEVFRKLNVASRTQAVLEISRVEQATFPDQSPDGSFFRPAPGVHQPA